MLEDKIKGKEKKPLFENRVQRHENFTFDKLHEINDSLEKDIAVRKNKSYSSKKSIIKHLMSYRPKKKDVAVSKIFKDKEDLGVHLLYKNKKTGKLKPIPPAPKASTIWKDKPKPKPNVGMSNRAARLATYSIMAILIVGFFAFFYVPQLSITGHATFAEEYSVYNDSVNFDIEGINTQYNWTINSMKGFYLRGLDVTGRIKGDGNVKMYLTDGEHTYLVLDSTRLDTEHLIGITGHVVSSGGMNISNETIEAINETIVNWSEAENLTINLTIEENETGIENETNGTTEEINETVEVIEEIEENETVEWNVTVEEEIEENITELTVEGNLTDDIQIVLEYNEGTLWDEDDDGETEITDVVDLTVYNTVFQKNLYVDGLCTKWQITDLDEGTAKIQCYGSDLCCNFVGVDPRVDAWNAPFFVMPTEGYNLNVTAQVIYIDYSLDIDNLYKETYYSEAVSLPVTFMPVDNRTVTEFEDMADMTALITEFLDAKTYTLIFEVDEGTKLEIDKITYALEEFNLTEVVNIPGNLTNVSSEKIKEDYRYDAIIDSAVQDNVTKDLTVKFHHDSPWALPITIKGSITNYTLSKDKAKGGENLTLTVYNWTDEFFRIVVGGHTEVIQFGTPAELNLNVDVLDYKGDVMNVTVEFIDSDTGTVEVTEEADTTKKKSKKDKKGKKKKGKKGKKGKKSDPVPVEEQGSLSTTVEEGVYDIKIKPTGMTVKEIRIDDMSVSSDITDFINIDDVPENGTNYVEVYAIDPTAMNFTNATVTVTAKGTTLHKCKDWNFTTQTCFGNWVVFKAGLVPGQNYTFTLTPDDPGFGETVSILFETFPNTATSWDGSNQDNTWVVNTNDAPDFEINNDGSAASPPHMYIEDGDQDWNGDWVYTDIDLSGYGNVKIEYLVAYQDMDSGEGVRIEFSPDGGNEWFIMHEHISSAYNSDMAWQRDEYDLSDGNATENFRLRFNVASSTSSDEVYIDNVNITGDVLINEIYGHMNVILDAPTPGQTTNANQNETFWVNATVTCDGEANAICGNVTAYARYNGSGGTVGYDCTSSTARTSGGTITAQGENGPSETDDMAFDDNTATKWLDFGGSGGQSWITYQQSMGYKIAKYAISSANDAQQRDPKDWHLEGSNDGSSWNILDTQTGIEFTARFQTQEFTIDNASVGNYIYYRLNVTDIWDSGTADSIQLSEIELYECTEVGGGESMTAINTTVGGLPFYTTSSQPQSCSLTQGQSCQFNWNVNATGVVGEKYNINVDFSSNYGEVADNVTGNATVNITGEAAPPNNAPTHDNPLLTSSSSTNTTNENLTCYNQSTADADSDDVKNIFNWKKDGSSITVLNMPFESNAATDYSGYDNDGTINGATWNATGGYDGKGAYEFGGDGDYIDFGTDGSLKPADTITVSVWVNIRSFGDYDAIIYNAFDTGTTESGYYMYTYSDNTVYFDIATVGTAFGYDLNTGALSSDTWYNIVGVYNGTHRVIYLNGQEQESIAMTGDIDWDPTPYGAYAGIYNDDNEPFYYPFNGTIDEIMVFNHSLSTQQIQALYNNRTDLIVSQETTTGDNWSCEVTPNDGNEDGTTKASNVITILDATPTVTINETVNDANNTPITTTILVYTLNGTLIYNSSDNTSHTTTVPQGLYDIKIITQGTTVSEMFFNNVSAMEHINQIVDIDDPPEIKDYDNFYAINPLLTNFTNATATITAVGNTLYKCVDWNFTAQSCNVQCVEEDNETECKEDWVMIQELIPGEEYNITINATDPGFIETSEAVDVAMAPINNTAFVIAWVDAVDADVSFKVMNTNGNTIVDTVDVDTTVDVESRVSLSMMNSTHFTIAWIDGPNNDVTRAVYDIQGNNVLAAIDVDTNVGANTDVSVAQMGDRYVVCYANDADNDADFKIYYNNGTEAVGESRVDGNIGPASPLQNLISCAGVNSTRWGYFIFDNPTNDTTLARMNETGGQIGKNDIDNDMDDKGQVAATGIEGDRIAMVYYDAVDEDISIAIRTVDNTVILAPTDIDTTASNATRVAIAAVREDAVATSDSFVVVWWDNSSSDIKAGVYENDGTQITAPFTIDTNQDTTYRLIDVAGRDTITGNTLCPGTFVVAYSNSSDDGVFKTYHVNGSEWNGICSELNVAPTHTTPILNSTLGTNLTSENLTCYNQSTFDNNGDDVKNIFNWEKDGSSITVLNMPFEGGSNSTYSKDYSGNNNDGTVTGATWSATSGHDGKGAYVFGGGIGNEFGSGSDYVSMGQQNEHLLGVNLTLEAWIKPAAQDVYDGIIHKIHDTGATESGYGIYLDGTSGVYFGLVPSGSGVTYLSSGAGTVTLDEWNHIVATYDGSTMRVYTNGVERTTQLISATTIDYTPVADLEIGRYSDDDEIYAFNGVIDEARIYNHTLTPEQITALYNNRTDLIVSNETTIGDVWYAEVTPNDGTEDGISLNSNNLTIVMAAVNNAPTHTTPILNSTLGTNLTSENLTCYNQSTFDNNGDSVKNIFNWEKDGSSITVLNMPFEGGSNSTYSKDYSGNNNDGTVTGATWNSTGGHDGKGAYVFDTTPMNISIPHNTIHWLNDDWTIMFYVYFDGPSTPGQYPSIIRKGEGNIADGGWNVWNTGTSITFKRNSNQGLSAGTLSTGVWHNVVLTYNDTSDDGYVYVDGVQVDYENYNYPDATSTAVLTLGYNPWNSPSINGSIDDILVLNRSLSPEQILAWNHTIRNELVSQETTIGDNWSCEVTPNDGTTDGTNLESNNLTVVEAAAGNNAPTHTTPILNSTLGTNLTSENLTCYNQSTFDNNSDDVKNIFNWKKDGSSITVLNMPFEGGSNSTYSKDYSGNNNDGMVTGATWNSTGGHDGKGAYEFDGDGDYIATGLDTGSMGLNWALSAWIKLGGSGASEQCVFGEDNGGDNLCAGVNNQLLWLRASDVSNTNFANTSITDNNWHHVMFISDVTGVSAYLDGVFGEFIADDLDLSGTNIIWLGSQSGASRDFNGTIDDVQIFNNTLSAAQIQALYENRTDLIVSQETTSGDNWTCEVTPNDGTDDGTSLKSNNLTIIGAVDTLNVTLIDSYALDSSLTRINNFNTTNIEEIEYSELNFSITSSGTIDTWYFNFTANGTNGCSLGNKQSSTCYNYPNWIQFINGTDTVTYDGTQGNQGDRIIPTQTGSGSAINLSLRIDEHYNPNVFKWYDAAYNFSDVKWQSANDQRIRNNKKIRILLNTTNIPLDADQYKVDCRINHSNNFPNNGLYMYLCNSTYTTGRPDLSPYCALVVQLDNFQDDGTKARGVFTKELVDTLGDIKYLVLDARGAGGGRYFYIKTYKATAPAYTTKWEYTTNNAATWNNLGDGYESECNINWFYNGASPTAFVYNFWANTTTGVIDSLQGSIPWDVDPSQNYPPIVAINNPDDNATINQTININWTTAEPNDDNYITNITLHNSTYNLVIASDLKDNVSTYSWNTTNVNNGWYNLTVESCENETGDLYCGNSTHEVYVTNSVLTVVGFTVTLPGQAPVMANGTGNATGTMLFNSSSNTYYDMDPCVQGTSDCQNNTVPFFSYLNTGNVNLNMSIYLETALPSLFNLTVNTVYNAAASTVVSTTPLTIGSEILPGGNLSVFFFGDFMNAYPTDSTTRNLVSNGTQS